MADGTLETERLILRPSSMDDFEWIREAINTPAVLRHLGGQIRTVEESREALERDLASFGKPDGYWRWTAFSRSDNRRLGRFGLFRVRSDAAPPALRGSPEVGWTVAEREWRQGFAVEGAAVIFDFAFATLPDRTVFAQTSDSNAGSTGVMRRLGLARRAELDYVDPEYPAADNPTTVWSIAADEWSARRG